MARAKWIRKTEGRLIKVGYFFKGIRAFIILTFSKWRGKLPKNSLQLYRDLARAHMDIKS